MLIKCPLECAGCEKGVCRKDAKSHVNDKLLSHVMMQSVRIKNVNAKLTLLKAACEQRMTKSEAILEQRMTILKTVFERRMAKLENKVGELDRMIASKPQPLGQPQQPDGHVTGTYKPVGAEFTMTNFEEYKRDNDIWYSPHFFTHPNGYKMCLRVDANGIASGRGTHLSVFVCLMRGEFDDRLKWPFQGNISIKLVNQREDRYHVIQTVGSRNASSERCKRVLTDERINNGWGFLNFLPHAELQPKYLKNDCIKLCIKKIELY